jgi:Protein of unknown function (DUF2950)
MSVATRTFVQPRIGRVGSSIICVFAMVLASLPLRAQQKETPKTSSSAAQQPRGKGFATPADAAAALYAAARRNEDRELLTIFGSEGEDVVDWGNDAKLRQEQRTEFADKYDQMHRLVKEPDDTVALYVGAENWPLPIPIVEYKGQWYFDTEGGKQEILYRRVGRNEMEALEVCRALLDAEKDYYSEVHNYTANFISRGDSHDGLYWPASDSAQKSPIGPYLAHAGATGPNTNGLEPYHGYYYRILLAPSGAGNGSSGGFAALAFPAEYRSSGVMTFIMEEDGNAYEKDLGPNTTELAKQITSSVPDRTWNKVK